MSRLPCISVCFRGYSCAPQTVATDAHGKNTDESDGGEQRRLAFEELSRRIATIRAAALKPPAHGSVPWQQCQNVAIIVHFRVLPWPLLRSANRRHGRTRKEHGRIRWRGATPTCLRRIVSTDRNDSSRCDEAASPWFSSMAAVSECRDYRAFPCASVCFRGHSCAPQTVATDGHGKNTEESDGPVNTLKRRRPHGSFDGFQERFGVEPSRNTSERSAISVCSSGRSTTACASWFGP